MSLWLSQNVCLSFSCLLIIKLEKICREIFDEETLCITEDTCAADIAVWDSLEHINLIMAVEKAFGVKFTMDEVISMKSIGEMADVILKK